MQSQISFMLCCHSFSQGGSDCTAYPFADKGCQYAVYISVQQVPTQIANDAKSKIVDDPLTLSFLMGQ
jgi:hypothetical protein